MDKYWIKCTKITQNGLKLMKRKTQLRTFGKGNNWTNRDFMIKKSPKLDENSTNYGKYG